VCVLYLYSSVYLSLIYLHFLQSGKQAFLFENYEIRSDQINSAQIKSNQIKSNQIREKKSDNYNLDIVSCISKSASIIAQNKLS
jgi:hypothetical protein